MAVRAQDIYFPVPQHLYGPVLRAPVKEERRVALEQNAHSPQLRPQGAGLVGEISLHMRQHDRHLLLLSQRSEILYRAGDSLKVVDLSTQKHMRKSLREVCP